MNRAARRHFFWFGITVLSVFGTRLFLVSGTDGMTAVRAWLMDAGIFTSSLLGILVAHESGHYIAARLHRVPASLPFFIPAPILSPFGTMGAVIRMSGRIASRRALLDIGASGPLAGLLVAIPLYIRGIQFSTLVPKTNSGQLGESVLMRALDHWFAPHVPDGQDLLLSPMAYAAWGGMLVTMINLLPLGQLDGGHVAYALLGRRQNRAAKHIHYALLAFFFVSLIGHVAVDIRAGFAFRHFGTSLANSIVWFVWFEMLHVLGQVSQPSSEAATTGEIEPHRSGGAVLRARITMTIALVVYASLFRESRSAWHWIVWFVGLGLLLVFDFRKDVRSQRAFEHPPTNDEPLGMTRALVGTLTLLFYALLFMPTPFSM